MTMARMIELKDALERSGWIVSSKSDDLFYVDDERVFWNIQKAWSENAIELIFYLFDDFGGRTRKLADILYVEDRDQLKRLYFSKISSNKWKEDLKIFVRSL